MLTLKLISVSHSVNGCIGAIIVDVGPEVICRPLLQPLEHKGAFCMSNVTDMTTIYDLLTMIVCLGRIF